MTALRELHVAAEEAEKKEEAVLYSTADIVIGADLRRLQIAKNVAHSAMLNAADALRQACWRYHNAPSTATYDALMAAIKAATD